MTTNPKTARDDLNLTALALGQCDEAERAEIERQLALGDESTLKALQHGRKLAEEVRSALTAGNPDPSPSLRDALRHRLRGKSFEEPIQPAVKPAAHRALVRWGVAGLMAASLAGLLFSVWNRRPHDSQPVLAQNTQRDFSSRGSERWRENEFSSALYEGEPSEQPAATEFELDTAFAKATSNMRANELKASKTAASGTSADGIQDGNSQVEMIGEMSPESAGRKGPARGSSGNGQPATPSTAKFDAYSVPAAGGTTAANSQFGAVDDNWAYDPGRQVQGRPHVARGRARFQGGANHFFFAESDDAGLSAGQPGALPRQSGGQAMGVPAAGVMFGGMTPGGHPAGSAPGLVEDLGGGGYGMMAGNAEQYAPIVENDFVSVQGQAAVSTFSIDVDTASYANVRRFLTQGQLPPANAVRIEELVNYFHYDYPQPKAGEPFSVHMEMAECPWQPRHLLLRVGLQGKEIHQKERPVSNLVFLLDVSGSMVDDDKLPLVKQALSLLVRELREDDRVSIVTYAGEAGLRLPPTTGNEQEKILAAIESLAAGGSTNGSAGIELAYEQAQAYFRQEGTNRVILATDGDLNVGITDDESLVKLIQEKAAGGTFLTVLGFGEGNLKDAKMERLADNGNGLYAYIDSLREARKVLLEQMSGSLVTIAKDVKLQIEFNPREVQSYRLLGYENRMLTAEEFDDDQRDAGEIGAGHSVTALYELAPVQPLIAAAEPAPEDAEPLKYQLGQSAAAGFLGVRLSEAAASGEILTLKLRYKEPDGKESQLREYPLKERGGKFSAASKDLQFASAVASFGMVLRQSQYRGDSNLAAVAEIAASSTGEDQGGYRAEFVELVKKAQELGVK